MRKITLWSVLSMAMMSGSLRATALPTFFLYPEVDLYGATGETVGWGFYIVNNDDTNWISITSLTLALQTNAAVLAPLGFTDYLSPVGGPTDFALEPYGSWWVNAFDPSAPSGAASYTIAADATLYAIDIGIMRLGYDVYDGDPLFGGNGLRSFVLPDDQSPSYSVMVASVTEPLQSSTPESPAWLTAMGGLAVVTSRLMRRMAGNPA